MNKSYSILFLIDSLTEGGAELALLVLVQTLCKQHYNVSIFAYRQPSRLATAFRHAGATLYLPDKQISETRFEAFSRLRTVLSKRYYDFVHASSQNTSIFLAFNLILPRHGKRVVTFQNVHYRSMPGLTWLSQLKEHLLLTILSFTCDGFTTDSYTNLVDYEKYSPHINLIHLPNCVVPPIKLSRIELLDARSRMNVGPNDFVILVPARYVTQKGHIILFQAIYQIKLKGAPMPKVVCFGDGDQFNNLSDFVRINNLGEFVFLNRVVPIVELQTFMLAADLIALPSLWESFGQVVIGAMELGKPVLGSDTGGIREQILHNQTGFLASPGHVSEWSYEIERLMSLSSLLSTVGIAARDSVSDKMTSEQIVMHLTDYYSSL